MKVINVSHGGHSGDIVYGLAFAKQLSANNGGCLIDLYVASNRPTQLAPGMTHPNGSSVMMTPTAFAFLEPLLLAQPWIQRVLFVPDAEIPPDALQLDPYRHFRGINLGAGNIADWPGKIYGVAVDVANRWLVTRPVKLPADSLMLGFTPRYRNVAIDYSFLARIEDLRFVGLESEYADFKARHGLPSLRHVRCENALELAEALQSSKAFLGNQSMAFALAEALKIKRALEVCEAVPNVVPSGPGGGSFVLQTGLLNLLRSFGYPVEGIAANNRAPDFRLFL